MKFGYTLLYVEDVEKTVVFYESAFGLQRKLLHENGYGEMDTGATALAFVSHAMAQAGGIEYSKPNLNTPAPAVEIAFVEMKDFGNGKVMDYSILLK